MSFKQVTKNLPTPPTPDEDLIYILEMMSQLQPKAENIDDTLNYFLEMTCLQARDLASGHTRAELKADQKKPPKDVKRHCGF